MAFNKSEFVRIPILFKVIIVFFILVSLPVLPCTYMYTGLLRRHGQNRSTNCHAVNIWN